MDDQKTQTWYDGKTSAGAEMVQFSTDTSEIEPMNEMNEIDEVVLELLKAIAGGNE